ncbi:MAG: pilus assembly protein FimV [Herbaspirillum sp.]|nr:pilus assembly protein FimV [Herbaspirillum sp.]
MLNQDKMPGAGSVTDTIEFMQKMWSSMGAPAMATPTLSVEDINKKIADLKTVASWLELNLNMLKATIQTLEVQSATLSTLQAMSAIMASREAPAGEAAAQGESGTTPPFPFGFPLWPAASAQEEPEQPEPEQEPSASGVVEEQEEDVVEEATEPQAAEAVPPTADFQSAIANPNAWWNVLQEQFKHAVGNALTGAAADQEPLLKPAKPPKTAKRSENKTVPPKAKAAPKAKPVAAPKAGTAAKPAPKKPPVKKAPKTGPNTSAPARAGVVQSRQNKKPASRKPTSP